MLRDIAQCQLITEKNPSQNLSRWAARALCRQCSSGAGVWRRGGGEGEGKGERGGDDTMLNNLAALVVRKRGGPPLADARRRQAINQRIPIVIPPVLSEHRCPLPVR